MRRKRIRFLTILIILTTVIFPVTVYANSSWHWISKTRPFDILPIIIIVTLLIEIFAINIISGIHNIKKVCIYVIISNLLSFAAPYIILLFTCMEEQIYTFWESLDTSPNYIIGIAYFVMTVLVELPVVYFGIKKNVKNKRMFIFTVIGSNIITTVLTAITERIICVGSW